jgi:hypothetical protein
MHAYAMHPRAIALFCSFAALLACPRPPPPVPPPQVKVAPSTSGSSPPAAELGPLVRLGLVEDHVAFADHEVHPDGKNDFGFRIRLSGEVLGLALVSSDTKGNKVPDACWDTFVGDTPLPQALGLGGGSGGGTIGLAVIDAHGVVLNPDGVLPPHTFHDEIITIWCPDPSATYFHEGRAFTLLVLRPGNRVDRSTVVIV